MIKSNLKKEDVITYKIMIQQIEELHFHQDVELIYVLEGNMELTVEKDTFYLEKDDLVVVNANRRHSYKCSENILMASFYISFKILSDYLDSNLILFWCNSTIDKDDSYEEMRKIIKLIFNHYLNRLGKNDFYEYSLFYRLLNILTSSFLISSKDKRLQTIDSRIDRRIDEIVNFIHVNYTRQISLNDLASKFHLSNSYLSRYLKKELGMNFVDYLNNIRLNKALEDLLYTDITITRAALDNGFANTALFNKLFKANYKVTPSEYLKKMRLHEERNFCNEDDEKNVFSRLDAHFEENKLDSNFDMVKDNKFIIVDANMKKAFNKNWNKVINIGSALDLLQSEMQEHVLLLKNELKFEYVRFWSIFGKEMYVSLSNKDGKFNFDKIDRVLDFLVNNKIKPFIEFGQKPKRINRTVSDLFIVEEDQTIFKDSRLWEKVIKAFAAHIVMRYGIEETQNWCFEVWSPEDLSISIDYIEIFNLTYTELKKYMNNCKVGGAGFRGDYGLKTLMKNILMWKEQSIQPDFISLYVFPYIFMEDKDEKYSKTSTDKNFLSNQIKQLKELLKEIKWDVKEIYVTEWNNTISNRNYMNDSSYKGAYIMKNIIDNIDNVDILSYWIGSDLFSEFYDSNVILNGGAGLISKKGIKKPAFYAFEFLNRMGNSIIDKGENYIITSNNHNGYYIACHNYKHFNYYYYLKKEDEIEPKDQNKIFIDYENLRLNFQLKNLCNGEYNVKTYSISRGNGSILDEWMKMETTSDLGKDEEDYLKRISTARLSIKKCVVVEELLNLEIILAPNEINIVHISYCD